MKILIWDIETSLMLVSAFSLDTKYIDPSNIIQDWVIYGGAWMWLGDEDSQVQSIYGKEKVVVKKLVSLMHEADMIIHHNGDAFDTKKLAARALFHGLPPFPDVPSVDTLKLARKRFKFTSNRLDYLGTFLGFGGKKHNNTNLWARLIRGDNTALEEMEEYNKRDVVLLKDVYLKLRGWCNNHPNHNAFLNEGDLEGCPKCGHTDLRKYGFVIGATGKKQKYQCQSCFGFCQGKKLISNTEIR